MIAEGGARPGNDGGGDGWVDSEETRLSLEGAGRVFVPLVTLALLLSWGAGGLALVLSAFGLAGALLAPLFAWRNLHGLRVRASGPGHHMVGESFLIELETIRRGRAGAAHDLLLAVAADPRAKARPAGHLARLDSGQRISFLCAHRWIERGRHTELCLSVYSSFPFGLLRCTRRFRVPVDFLALPRLGSLADLSRLPSGGVEASALERRIGQLEDEFYQLREWREGESLRRVHWKLSARRRRPILRDLRSRAEAPLCLILYTGVRRRARARPRRSRSFETAVSLVATLGEHYLRRGRAVQLVLLGEERVVHPRLRGRSGLFQLLAVLAEVQPETAAEVTRVEELLAEAALDAEASIAVVAAGGKLGSDRRRQPSPSLVIDVESARIDSIFQRGRSWGATPVIPHGEGR